MHHKYRFSRLTAEDGHTAPEGSDRRGDSQKSRVSPLPGIDTEAAITGLCVTPEIFENILRLFYRNNKTLMGKIRQACAEKDWHTVKELAHSVKGGAANIRAMALADSAQALENAAGLAMLPLAPTPPKAIRQRLTADLKQVLDAIESATGISSAPSPLENSRHHGRLGPGIHIDRSRFGTLLGDFIHALDLSVPEDIRRHLEDMRPLLQDLNMKEVEDCIDRYDYDEAREHIIRLADEMDIPIDMTAPGKVGTSEKTKEIRGHASCKKK